MLLCFPLNVKHHVKVVEDQDGRLSRQPSDIREDDLTVKISGVLKCSHRPLTSCQISHLCLVVSFL